MIAARARWKNSAGRGRREENKHLWCLLFLCSRPLLGGLGEGGGSKLQHLFKQLHMNATFLQHLAAEHEAVRLYTEQHIIKARYKVRNVHSLS